MAMAALTAGLISKLRFSKDGSTCSTCSFHISYFVSSYSFMFFPTLRYLARVCTHQWPLCLHTLVHEAVVRVQTGSSLLVVQQLTKYRIQNTLFIPLQAIRKIMKETNMLSQTVWQACRHTSSGTVWNSKDSATDLLCYANSTQHQQTTDLQAGWPEDKRSMKIVPRKNNSSNALQLIVPMHLCKLESTSILVDCINIIGSIPVWSEQLHTECIAPSPPPPKCF